MSDEVKKVTRKMIDEKIASKKTQLTREEALEIIRNENLYDCGKRLRSY